MKTWIHKNAGTLAIVFGLVVVAAAGPVEDAVQAADQGVVLRLLAVLVAAETLLRRGDLLVVFHGNSPFIS